jgi:hypothetical protein
VVRELAAVLRSIVDRTGATVLIVHHDVKPNREGLDNRARGHRASGGDWFAMSECPVHFEKVTDYTSAVAPEDYKFSADPAPFEFTCKLEDQADGTALVVRLGGRNTTAQESKTAGVRMLVLKWIVANPSQSKTKVVNGTKKGQLEVYAAIDQLEFDNLVSVMKVGQKRLCTATETGKRLAAGAGDRQA